jgi:hypothetical protein
MTLRLVANRRLSGHRQLLARPLASIRRDRHQSGRRFSVDAAAFDTSTNIKRQLRPALALSLRINRAP